MNMWPNFLPSLLKGQPMFNLSNAVDYYYWPTPNGQKVAIFLEESELPYVSHPINISNGEQFSAEFTRIYPISAYLQS